MNQFILKEKLNFFTNKQVVDVNVSKHYYDLKRNRILVKSFKLYYLKRFILQSFFENKKQTDVLAVDVLVMKLLVCELLLVHIKLTLNWLIFSLSLKCTEEITIIMMMRLYEQKRHLHLEHLNIRIPYSRFEQQFYYENYSKFFS